MSSTCGSNAPGGDRNWKRSQRVQHAEGDLVGAGRTRAIPGYRPEPFHAERVAPRPVAQQGVADVIQLAGEGKARLIGVPRRVWLVHAVEGPQAPVGVEVVARLSPRAPAPNPHRRGSPTRCRDWSSVLRDVPELLSQPLSVVDVAVQRALAPRHVETRLDPPRGPGGTGGG